MSYIVFTPRIIIDVTKRVKSRMLLQELKEFSRRAGSYAARSGSTDDCVSAVLIIMRILEEISSFEQAAFDTLRHVDDYSWGEDDVTHYDEDGPDGPLPGIFV